MQSSIDLEAQKFRIRVKILLFFIITFIFLKPCYSFDFKKVKKVINHLKPYHFTIITKHLSVGYHENRCNKMIDQTPVIITDLQNTSVLNGNQSTAMQIYRNPRQSTVNVVIVKKNRYQNSHLNFTCHILNDLVDISPVRPRPKTLLILLDDNWSDDAAKVILKYGWSLKFLDFSILKSNGNNKTVFMHYNPFAKSFIKSTKKVFPDKLNDGKKYPLFIFGYNLPPFFTIDSNNETAGTEFNFIKIIIKKLNFKERIIMATNYGLKLLEESLKKLERNTLSITSISLFSSRFINREVTVGDVFEIDKVTVVAPIIRTSRVYFSLEVLLFILSFPLIITTFIIFSKFFKFNPQRWNFLYIFQIFIGYPSSSPDKRIEKIIFLLIAILSIIYSNIFFDKFADMKFVEAELELNSVKEIFETKMKIYSIYSAVSDDSPELKDLFSKSEKVNEIDDCINKVIDTQSSICISVYNFAKYSVKKHINSKGMPIMKIIDWSARPEFSHFAYEKASPFAEKFDKMIQQIKEYGISKIKKINFDTMKI